MTVTGLEAATKTKFKVYLDHRFAFVLYKGELSRYGIREGAELEDVVFKKIMDEVICKRAKLRAMHLLEDMDRSESALREKLRQGLYPQEAIECAVSYVSSFGYLNDERYAQNFVESRKSAKSRREIYYQLCQKGVSREIAERALEECYEGGDELEAIRRMIQKKRVDLKNAEPEQIRKLYGYLSRKGFRYEDIRQVIQIYNENA